ncbi:hypothetical protein AMAG_20603 [Allomyces macrogynus ATCC 38327]|uniref:Uncharacterized protein n=1 Tax=Allomyces macrogynus (strain ATCC 38327) TaxID=578462 RepID=A0A0L0TCJ0_ALLM3|nr:hypothetical protein AMAG_20603 [Allomyces macrogynus ATCC 38327]|eukprot:KNE72553.1 hypothetical protein AMAG_20603 [Allomyces macrogynus ATCC 38327]
MSCTLSRIRCLRWSIRRPCIVARVPSRSSWIAFGRRGPCCCIVRANCTCRASRRCAEMVLLRAFWRRRRRRRRAPRRGSGQVHCRRPRTTTRKWTRMWSWPRPTISSRARILTWMTRTGKPWRRARWRRWPRRARRVRGLVNKRQRGQRQGTRWRSGSCCRDGSAPVFFFFFFFFFFGSFWFKFFSGLVWFGMGGAHALAVERAVEMRRARGWHGHGGRAIEMGVEREQGDDDSRAGGGRSVRPVLLLSSNHGSFWFGDVCERRERRRLAGYTTRLQRCRPQGWRSLFASLAVCPAVACRRSLSSLSQPPTHDQPSTTTADHDDEHRCNRRHNHIHAASWTRQPAPPAPPHPPRPPQPRRAADRPLRRRACPPPPRPRHGERVLMSRRRPRRASLDRTWQPPHGRPSPFRPHVLPQPTQGMQQACRARRRRRGSQRRPPSSRARRLRWPRASRHVRQPRRWRTHRAPSGTAPSATSTNCVYRRRNKNAANVSSRRNPGNTYRRAPPPPLPPPHHAPAAESPPPTRPPGPTTHPHHRGRPKCVRRRRPSGETTRRVGPRMIPRGVRMWTRTCARLSAGRGCGRGGRVAVGVGRGGCVRQLSRRGRLRWRNLGHATRRGDSPSPSPMRARPCTPVSPSWTRASCPRMTMRASGRVPRRRQRSWISWRSR